jgi:hypothetical protein
MAGMPTSRPHRFASPRSARASARAKDILLGYVRAVLDTGMVDMNLIGLTSDQRERYRDSELVRLVGTLVEGQPAAIQAELLRRLHRRRVRCFVHGRDDEGRLVAVAVPVADG